jgi:type 1 glutamine amidotransferase
LDRKRFQKNVRLAVMARILGTLLAVVGIVAPAFAQDAAKTKIVLVGTQPDHPYASHMYLHECRMLAQCLRLTAGVEAVVVQDWPQDAAMLENVKSLVYYSRPAGDIVLSHGHREQFEKLMAAGVGYVAIHWATDANPERGPDYLNVLGGWFNRAQSGLNVNSGPLVQIVPNHPICRGWKTYPLRDEFYLDLKFHERAQPVLQVTVDGRPQTVAWAFERPDSHGGRSFGTTLGHFHENFEIESFRRFIVNGILWSAHLEVPEAGAPVNVSEADLKLPPEEKTEKK